MSAPKSAVEILTAFDVSDNIQKREMILGLALLAAADKTYIGRLEACMFASVIVNLITIAAAAFIVLH